MYHKRYTNRGHIIRDVLVVDALDSRGEVWICWGVIRAVYTRENKPRITQSASYVSRELSHLYDNSLYKKLVRGLRKPRTSISCRLYEQFVLCTWAGQSASPKCGNSQGSRCGMWPLAVCQDEGAWLSSSWRPEPPCMPTLPTEGCVALFWPSLSAGEFSSLL